MKIYFISGIGADYRIFTHIILPEGYKFQHLHWITPDKAESLQAYAIRLAAPIGPDEPCILIGFSLGGMMATEIAKVYRPALTILISSVPLSSQLPPYYRWAQRLRLPDLVSPKLMKFVAAAKHTLTMRRNNRKIMREIIRSGNDRFIAWAIQAVLNWKNETVPKSLVHIHGACDEVFPAARTHPDHLIPKAGHNLVMTHPESVNKILRQILPAAQPPSRLPSMP